VERNQRAGGTTPTQPATPFEPTSVNSNVGSTGAGPTVDPKARYGFLIVIAGLVSVIVLYIGTILIFANLTPENLANNVVACMGAITGVVGSLVGAYFGVQLGSAGKEASDASAVQNAALASAAMGQIDDPNKSTTAIQNAQSLLQTQSPST
jgi:hypothetical protein